MSRKILSLDSNFEDKRKKPVVQKIDDSIFIVEDFLPDFYENFLEKYFLDINLEWNLEKNIAFNSKLSPVKTKRIGYSIILTNIKNESIHEAFNFIFPMVNIAFDVIGMKVKDYIMSRAFKTTPTYSDAEPTHVDTMSPHWVCLYYPHTVDGFTVLMNETYPNNSVKEPNSIILDNRFKFSECVKIHPKKGRCILFNGNRYHCAFRSKSKERVVINTNVII